MDSAPAVERTLPDLPTANQPVMAPPVDLSELKNLYIAQLLRHIEQYKHYPIPARRRGIEGLVQVSFTLSENGRIHDLRVEGGHNLLNKATQRAIEKALPLPASPESIDLPIRLSFNLKYSLSL